MSTIIQVSHNQRRTLRQTLNDQAFALISISIVAFGTAILAVAQVNSWWIGRDWQHAPLEQLGSIIIAATGLALIWEWRGRRAMTNEVFEMAKTASTLREAGLTGYSNNYLGEDWSEYFRDARDIEIFLVYGRTWRMSHRQELIDALKDSSTRIRVVLGSTSQVSENQKVLADRFSEEVSRLASYVEDAIREYKEIAKDAKGQLQIYSWEGDHLFSGYRFDKRAVITLYSHAKERQSVPTLTCAAPGLLFTYVYDELFKIRKNSSLVFDSKEVKNDDGE